MAQDTSRKPIRKITPERCGNRGRNRSQAVTGLRIHWLVCTKSGRRQEAFRTGLRLRPFHRCSLLRLPCLFQRRLFAAAGRVVRLFSPNSQRLNGPEARSVFILEPCAPVRSFFHLKNQSGRVPGSDSMKPAILPCVILAAVFLTNCGEKPKPDPAAEAPPAAVVEHVGETAALKVDHPEQFPLVDAGKSDGASTLSVTGTVTPDVSRSIPVVSLASGRVIDISAKLGDVVKKGQLLLRIDSADISGAFATYRSAVASAALAASQLDRAQLLYDHQALARKDLEIAADADARAKIAVENAVDQVRVLGADVNHPSSIVNIVAPASGVITEQNVAAAAGVKTLDNSPNLFTISDLSNVWILCDVYENDLAAVREDEPVEVRLNAYPDRVFNGRVTSIGPILDPALRTAKVRVELANPGIMRVGMFVSAIFHGNGGKPAATVPATAVLHLHDRDWVYLPSGANTFRRTEVVGGPILPSKLQVISSGLAPGDKVVSNALEMQNTVEQ